MAKAWQTRACNPATRPAYPGLVRGMVSRGRRTNFSSVGVAIDGEGTAHLPPRAASCCGANISCATEAMRGIRRLCSSSSRERASQEAARQGVPAAHARACRHSDEDPRGRAGASSSSLSCEDFDNHAG